MSNEPIERDPPAKAGVTRSPPKFFCIHSYAGELGPPCGWRGRAAETLRDAKTGGRRCPQCGRTTLLEIPPVALG